MKLTRYTDYALRVLMFLAARPERQATIREIAGSYAVSQNHLMKVVQNLGKHGYVTASRGRTGGLRLARPAADINVGEVVRHTEEGMQLADCGSCVIAPACGLTAALDAAVGAFMRTLDSYTLADLVEPRADRLRAIFAPPAVAAASDA